MWQALASGIGQGLMDMASSAVNTALSYTANKKLMKKTAETNWKYYKKQLEAQDQYQRAYSRDQTKWAYLYTPSMQMEGLRSAGLNPILAYGFQPQVQDGQFGGAQMTSAGGVSASGSKAPDIVGTAKSLSDRKRTETMLPVEKQGALAGIENTKANTDLTATKVSSEETQQDVDSAQAEKLREETRGVKLTNDLKAATNARDVARAKSEYDAEQGTLDRYETDIGTSGGAAKHVKTPYERKIEALLENDTYLNSRERSILLDAARAIEGGVSAYGTIKGARNGGMFAGAARKGAAASSKNAETNRRNVELKERAEQRMLRRRKKK